MGRAIMFMLFVWVMVSIAGNMMQGELDFARTKLTADLSSSGTTINVSSTTGFPDSGIIQVENERIAYSSKTATTFVGSAVKPMVRGAEDTTAAEHVSGKAVSTVQGSMMNSSVSYNIAVLTDSAGSLAFVSMPLAFISLLGSFFTLPIKFLGTDLQILTFIWAVVGAGVIVALGVQLAGGRRV